jgi:hypothetical protein
MFVIWLLVGGVFLGGTVLVCGAAITGAGLKIETANARQMLRPKTAILRSRVIVGLRSTGTDVSLRRET